MKHLNQYIKESMLDDEDKIINKKYIYQPQTKDELKSIIGKEIERQRGKDIINLNMIDISKITNMRGLFRRSIYNFDISEWDVSNIEDMTSMFNGCHNFNSDLSKWDVSKVIDMSFMFANCEKFNSDLSKWNISNVKDMMYMFYGCTNFNSDLSKWNVFNVKNMSYMFDCCTSLKKLPDWYEEG